MLQTPRHTYLKKYVRKATYSKLYDFRQLR